MSMCRLLETVNDVQCRLGVEGVGFVGRSLSLDDPVIPFLLSVVLWGCRVPAQVQLPRGLPGTSRTLGAASGGRFSIM